MILKNYWEIFAMIMARKKSAPVKITKTDGNEAIIYYNSSNATSNASGLWFGDTAMTTAVDSSGVIFGTGTTPPTAEDFRLSGTVVTGIKSTTNFVGTYDELGGGFTVTYTITNNNADPVTIGEVGVIMRVYHYNSSSDNTNRTSYAMIERSVLDEPIVIPAGSAGQVVFSIRMNKPSN